ncbi:CDP-diacylglycerol--inositol 3-phosphatidyltransferase [Meloidogyne graminicola]|uniref:CDP-diacylglycerol--inositol 3-phosphatidyltransferase n=1 Tax=Meloidogyne graminicola TaxID=189291 RepID=A0A8S9ZUY0_9BILA|nr:CDP-diacylglycerol--inositol 3-phosphatidyltransferase [Meloidogyne graminicola]
MDFQYNPIYLFYPNLIGYLRIIFALFSFLAMPTRPLAASFWYFLSAFLDAFDGYLARKFNQTSRFGAMLDQLTDRCTFLGLLMALCHFYPSCIFGFQFVGIIDIASHWLHLHSGDLTGKALRNRKIGHRFNWTFCPKINFFGKNARKLLTHKESKNPVLNYYYTSRPFLFAMCFGNEAFYGLLYISNFWPGPSLYFFNLMTLLAILVFPVAALKSGISLVHLVTAAQTLAKHDLDNLNKQQK